MKHPHVVRSVVALALVFGIAAPAGSARAAGCPSGVRFEPTAEGTVEAGWNGLVHGQPILGPALDLTISCPASSPPCGACTITGLAAGAGFGMRCLGDSSIACTPATEVADCGAPATCRTFLAAPTSLGVGGLPFCYAVVVDGQVAGTVDVETGAFDPYVPVRAEVRTGQSYAPGGGPMVACPRCIGDPVPNDGVRGGTCDAGTRAGFGCDAHGTSSLADFGTTSLDCPYTTFGGPFTFQHIRTFASTGTTTFTLSGASPACTGESGTCFCSTCNDAAAEPCANNADCPLSGGNPGICGGKRCLSGANNGAPCSADSSCPGGVCNRPGELTHPNACLDDTTTPTDCIDVGDDHGMCSAGPVSSHCTNETNRVCTEDADCNGVPGACVTTTRPCFTDEGMIGATVSVSGSATPPVAGIAEPTELGSLTCAPATGSSIYNAIGGYPGLVRARVVGRLVFGDATPAPTPAPTATPTTTPTPPPSSCPSAPDACRTSLVPGKSSIQVTDRAPDTKDRFAWQWRAGDATRDDFAEVGGDPTTTTSYDLCIYDGSGLRRTLAIPAGGTCSSSGKPCWKAQATGFTYRDPSATPSGVTQLALRAGAAGKAQIKLKGAGSLLALPAPMSLVGTVQVQLRNASTGLCFGTTFVPPFDKLTAEQLKDRAE